MANYEAATTIFVRGLTRKFGAHTAVKAIDLELKRGEVLGFLGPNGAGKTTTMQMLTGNLAPTAGEIRICEIDLLDHPTAAKMKIGYLPEAPPLYRELNVDEYLLLVAKLHRIAKSSRRDAIEAVKQRCGLGDVGRKLIGILSKGFQQRVGIAQAIIHQPDVVVLDEPTSGLDPNQIREIRSLIREIGSHHSVILSTHILPEVEAVCDRVQIMHHGNLIYGDTIAALKDFENSPTILLGLRHPPAPDQLNSIPGVVKVEKAAETLFRVQFARQTDPTEEIVNRSVERKWGLYRSSPAQTSLEEVFINLTRSEGNA